MGPSNRNGVTAHGDTAMRELDAAVAALVAMLDEAMATAADAARPLVERADALARVGRTVPPVPFAPVPHRG